MTDRQSLKSAVELARNNGVRFPDGSDEYRSARDALLAEEIELRRHIERVAEQRRAPPPGGEVTRDYRFEGENGTVSFAELFGDKQTLAVYSYMYGPERKRPCPMCTSLLSAWDGRERGWRHLRLYSDVSGDYTRDYVSAEDADIPAFNVFTRRDGPIRHFWSGEMGSETADPGQDPRGAPDLMPLWTILDATPEGRGTDWYPKLEYAKAPA